MTRIASSQSTGLHIYACRFSVHGRLYVMGISSTSKSLKNEKRCTTIASVYSVHNILQIKSTVEVEVYT